MPMIQLEQVSKTFDHNPVLDGISFSVKPGEFVGLIGPNGSGKSTLLRLLSGVDKQTAGCIRLRGRDVHAYARKELAAWLAVLEQDALPPVGFSVREVIEMGRFPFQNWLGHEQGTSSESLIDAIINRLHLAELANRPVHTVSGGQRQRVALGRVMAQEPQLLLLDEPTTYLDIAYQIQLMDYVRGWQMECEMTVVAVLHDLNLAAQYCTRLIVLHEGKLVADGTPSEIMTNELIARVYGTEPIVLPHPVSGVPQILLQSETGSSSASHKGERMK
jgi:iron complex transport system ATP-binding protein